MIQPGGHAMGVSVIDYEGNGRAWIRIHDKRLNGGKRKLIGGFGIGLFAD